MPPAAITARKGKRGPLVGDHHVRAGNWGARTEPVLLFPTEVVAGVVVEERVLAVMTAARKGEGQESWCCAKFYPDLSLAATCEWRGPACDRSSPASTSARTQTHSGLLAWQKGIESNKGQRLLQPSPLMH